jgi:hypothetical protein
VPGGEFEPSSQAIPRTEVEHTILSPAWGEPIRGRSIARSPTPPPLPPEPSTTSLGKRRAGERDDDDEEPRPRKVSKKTQIACFFCRGRSSSTARMNTKANADGAYLQVAS